VFMVVHHIASTASPYHWLVVIGLLLILTVLYLPKGLIYLIPAGLERLRDRQGTHE
jgi:branched-chain amino acid transport system permease protein